MRICLDGDVVRTKFARRFFPEPHRSRRRVLLRGCDRLEADLIRGRAQILRSASVSPHESRGRLPESRWRCRNAEALAGSPIAQVIVLTPMIQNGNAGPGRCRLSFAGRAGQAADHAGLAILRRMRAGSIDYQRRRVSPGIRARTWTISARRLVSGVLGPARSPVSADLKSREKPAACLTHGDIVGGAGRSGSLLGVAPLADGEARADRRQRIIDVRKGALNRAVA